ncbi:MAG: F0F1 ATP synthase subunit delta [Desulfohalobiaceae bacterium]|nr:F0F1 ATP synthase subunit delta [Desulfohalobiaceae bacterium]
MKEQVIAKRYARALFALGQEQGDEELNRYGRELSQIASVIEASPHLLKILKNPIIKTGDKKGILRKIMQKLEVGTTIQNFCLFLADKERLGNFPDIQHTYSSLLDARSGVLRGKLITAIELAKARQDKVTKQLEGQLSQKLVLEYEANKDILGGLVLKVGDKIYDASLRAQLDQLKEQIKKG